MGRFIGEDLNEQEVAVLQAVAFNAGGAQVGSADKLMNTISSHRQCRAAEELSEENIACIINKLETDCLIFRKEIKGNKYIGLTEDGRHCNLIDAMQL